jgi:hypothetical protein
MSLKQPMASLLQSPFLNCKELLLQSYNLKFYPLQMIHLSRALLHAIISLAESITRLEAKSNVQDARNMTMEIRTRMGVSHGGRIRGRTVWQLGEILDPDPAYLDTMQLLEDAPLLTDKLERSVFSPLVGNSMTEFRTD